MSFFEKYFDALERTNQSFFDRGFFRFPDPVMLPRVSEELDEKPSFDLLKDPFFLETGEEKEGEEEVEEKGEDEDDQNYTKFSVWTKKSVKKGGDKREISLRREGDSRKGEVVKIRKRVNDRHLTLVKKKRKDGTEKLDEKTKKIRAGEESKFLNDWKNFGFLSNGEPKKLEFEEEFKSPRVERHEKKLENMDERERRKYQKKKKKKERKRAKHVEKKKRKKEKKKRKYEKKKKFYEDKPEKPTVFYSQCSKMIKVNGEKRIIKSKRVRTSDGKEKRQISRKFGGKKLVEKIMRGKEGVETISKKYKNLKKDEVEEFMKNFEAIPHSPVIQPPMVQYFDQYPLVTNPEEEIEEKKE